MKTLVFVVASYNLAEIDRYIEIAGACTDLFNVDIPIKGTQNDLQIAFFLDFQIKKLKNFKFRENFP